MNTLHANAHARNFLLTTFEGGGSVGPVIVVAKKLLARGHKVRVMSDECNRAEAEQAGARFVAWTRAPSRLDRSRHSDQCRDWEAPGPDALKRWLDGVFCGPALAFAQDVIDELQREPADLVVSNELILGPGIACEAIGQKIALLACNPLFAPVQGGVPMGMGLRPARSDAERAEHGQITQMVHGLFDHGLPAVNGARAALGLSPLAHALDQIWPADRVLVASARAFDFNAEFMPEMVRYVGPQVASAAWAQPWESPWAANDERPLIVVGFSTTFQNHSGVLQRVIDAASDLPVRMVVTLGGSIDASEVRAAPNAHVVHSAPHEILMRNAAVVVTHGGHGTVMQALLNQKPLLVLPHGRDQNDNGARVAEKGAGLVLDAGAAMTEIRAALQALLNDPAFTQAARDLGARVQAEAANSQIVAELEHLASAYASNSEPQARRA